MKYIIQELTDRFNAYAKALLKPYATLVTERYENTRLEQIHDAEGELLRENEIASTRWYEARKDDEDYKIVECTRISPENGLLIVEPYKEKPVQLKGGKSKFDGYEATKILSELEHNLSKAQGWSKAKKQPQAPIAYNRKGLEF